MVTTERRRLPKPFRGRVVDGGDHRPRPGSGAHVAVGVGTESETPNRLGIVGDASCLKSCSPHCLGRALPLSTADLRDRRVSSDGLLALAIGVDRHSG